jgi:hypothetical protein
MEKRFVDQILRIRQTGGLLEGVKLTTGTASLLAAIIPTWNESCALCVGRGEKAAVVIAEG